jgi:hypothetical protein
MTTTCPNGHPVAAGQRFCPECGAALNDAASSQEAPTTPPPPPPPPPPATPTRNKTFLILGGAALGIGLIAVLLLVLFGGGNEYLMQGEFALYDSDSAANGCVGTGGYNDIRPGVSVTVRDGGGDTIATGALGSGEVTAGEFCTYNFRIEVPDADFYRVEVAGRGSLSTQSLNWNGLIGRCLRPLESHRIEWAGSIRCEANGIRPTSSRTLRSVGDLDEPDGPFVRLEI